MRMTENERKVYKEKMKEIKQALREGNEEKANRKADELKAFLGIR